MAHCSAPVRRLIELETWESFGRLVASAGSATPDLFQRRAGVDLVDGALFDAERPR
jgi:hypothetical protein